MDGASNGSLAVTSHPEGTVPEDVRFLLHWSPPPLTLTVGIEPQQSQQDSDPGLPPKKKKKNTRKTGYSRSAAFYDKHLAPHLILKRVIYLDTLVSAMGSTVDQAIENITNNQFLPKKEGMLVPERMIRGHHELSEWSPYHELGVANTYQKIADYCQPIASTLAVHPSSNSWDTALVWGADQKEARWVIADGILRISRMVNIVDHRAQKLMQNEDVQTKNIIQKLAAREAVLAVWEMKHLTVGTAEVMREIEEMGATHATFQWEKCPHHDCTTHRGWKSMEESKKDYDPGSDPRSPPWTLPITSAAFNSPSTPLRDSVPAQGSATSTFPPFTSAANSPSTPLHNGLRSAAQGGMPRPSYKDQSSSSVEDGKVLSRKRPRDDPDASEYGPAKKPRAELMDESYEPPPGERREVNAKSFLQQTWAEAVRGKCTVLVLHSGNHEIIGIRHRGTQTLFISGVIEPHRCINPAYGKIHVGIYIAAIKEAIDREEQDIERGIHDPSSAANNEEANSNEDQDDYDEDQDDYDEDQDDQRESPSRRTRGSGSEGKRKGGHGGTAKRHASGKDDQALLANAAKQNQLCLRFFYDIYDSPHPATFRRLPDGRKIATSPAKPQPPPFPPGRETTPISMSSSMHITVHSEMQPGSTGIVHLGTMAIDPSGPTAGVAVKIAFSRSEKARLVEEHQMYSDLHSRGVQGIPHDIGLFVDGELLLGAEGPYALVMSYAGVSVTCSKLWRTSDSVKQSLLETLNSIHTADILHGDIRLSNLCITPSGDAFLIDFSHSTRSCSQEGKAQEIKELSRILGVDSTTDPAANDKKKVFRRSARIKELAQKSNRL